MDGNVQSDAAAGVGPIDSPALKVRGQIDGVKNARRKRSPDRSALDQFAHLAVGRRISEMVVSAHHDARGGCGRDHCPRAVE